MELLCNGFHPQQAEEYTLSLAAQKVDKLVHIKTDHAASKNGFHAHNDGSKSSTGEDDADEVGVEVLRSKAVKFYCCLS